MLSLYMGCFTKNWDPTGLFHCLLSVICSQSYRSAVTQLMPDCSESTLAVMIRIPQGYSGIKGKHTSISNFTLSQSPRRMWRLIARSVRPMLT